MIWPPSEWESRWVQALLWPSQLFPSHPRSCLTVAQHIPRLHPGLLSTSKSPSTSLRMQMDQGAREYERMDARTVAREREGGGEGGSKTDYVTSRILYYLSKTV